MENNLLGGFIVAILFFVIGIAAAIIFADASRRRRYVIKMLHVVLITVFLSGISLFYPIVFSDFQTRALGWLVSVFVSAQKALQLFSLDADYGMIQNFIGGFDGWLPSAYYIFSSFLYIIAPILTAGFLLSFVQNIASYQQYLARWNNDAFVFSELNEKSLALAQSVLETSRENGKKAVAVYTDVYAANSEPSAELISEARKIGAILFKKDILAIRLDIHSKKSALNFYVMGADESENIGHAMGLFNRYSQIDNSTLYVFSSTVSSEILLNGKMGNMHLKRINEVQSLIYHTLFEHGKAIFDNAYAEGGQRVISVVLLGLGHYGSEMLKALSWFAQMDGYDLVINAYDMDNSAEDRLRFSCPELLDDAHNNTKIAEEATYDIVFHSGVNTKSEAFSQSVLALKKATYVFVALGDDEKNIEAAVDLRMLLKRKGDSPIIHAVVKNSDNIKAIITARNHSEESYDISFVGELETQYSDEVIMNSDLEKKAMDRHLFWVTQKQDESDEVYALRVARKTADFYQYEYFYRSSMASVIHKEMRVHCNIPGADRDPFAAPGSQNARTEDEKKICRRLEHRRWNAYMRSDGFVFSGNTDKSTRCDLAKQHPWLVPYNQLPEEALLLDDD